MTVLCLEGGPLQVQPPVPQAGTTAQVQVCQDGIAQAGVAVRVTAPAGGSEAELHTVGTTNADGVLDWAVEQPGLAILHAGDDRLVLAVDPAGAGAGTGLGLGLLAILLALTWACLRHSRLLRRAS